MGAVKVERQAVVRPLWRNIPFDLVTVGLLAVFAYGFGVWIYQLSNGLIVTGMRDVVTWGLYITFFMFFVGLSAGGLIVASAGSIFGVERLKPLSRLAIWVSLVCVALAAFFIVPDIGRPDRLWNLFRYPNWSSPLIWDVIIIGVYGVISVAYLWLHSRQDLAERKSRWTFGFSSLTQRARDWDKRLIAGMAFVALPAAISLHSITAWIFGFQFARPFWFTGILAPLFITSALVSGLALLLVIMLVTRQLKLFEVPKETFSWLGGLLAVFIVVDFFLLSAEFLTRQWSQEPAGQAAVNLLMTGKYMWVFWPEVAFGIIAFGLMFVPRFRMVPALVGAAATLALVSIFLKRLGLILVGFYNPLVGAEPGIPLGEVRETTALGLPGISSFEATGVYAPTWAEVSIIIGVLALGVLLIMWGIQVLPLWERETAEAANPGSEEQSQLGQESV